MFLDYSVLDYYTTKIAMALFFTTESFLAYHFKVRDHTPLFQIEKIARRVVVVEDANNCKCQ